MVATAGTKSLWNPTIAQLMIFTCKKTLRCSICSYHKIRKVMTSIYLYFKLIFAEDGPKGNIQIPKFRRILMGNSKTSVKKWSHPPDIIHFETAGCIGSIMTYPFLGSFVANLPRGNDGKYGKGKKRTPVVAIQRDRPLVRQKMRPDFGCLKTPFLLPSRRFLNAPGETIINVHHAVFTMKNMRTPQGSTFIGEANNYHKIP